MKYPFEIPSIPGAKFELDQSTMTGKMTLTMNGETVPQTKDKEKAFLIPGPQGNVIKAIPKYNGLTTSLSLLVDGKTIVVSDGLQWYELVFGFIPIALVSVGGAIGGGIGALGMVINMQVMRRPEPLPARIVISLGISALCFAAWYSIASMVVNAVG
jgi:hypothetical protein